MAAVSTIIAGVGLAIGAAGAGVQYSASQKQAAAMEKGEELRKKQMNLDAQRRTRQVIREGLIARSQALTNATAQGAEAGSGLQGGYAGIQSNTLYNASGIEQNRQIGSQIFDANKQYAQAGSQMALGQGISSLGGAMVQNSQTLGRIYTYATTPRTV